MSQPWQQKIDRGRERSGQERAGERVRERWGGRGNQKGREQNYDCVCVTEYKCAWEGERESQRVREMPYSKSFRVQCSSGLISSPIQISHDDQCEQISLGSCPASSVDTAVPSTAWPLSHRPNRERGRALFPLPAHATADCRESRLIIDRQQVLLFDLQHPISPIASLL